MSTAREYYERYWAEPRSAPPSADPTTAVRKAMLRRALTDVPAGAKVLDVGCGTGEFTAMLREMGYDACGTDLSDRAIAAARERVPQGDFRVGETRELLPEFAGAAHAVWCSEVIEHVYDVYGFLAALHACLRPGGLLILTTPYHGVVKNLVIDLCGYSRHYDPFGGHIRFFDRASMRRCLSHCGFTPRRWDGYGRPWPLFKSFFVVAEKTHDVAGEPPANS